MANASVDEIIAIGKQKGVDMSKYEAKLRQKFGQSGIPIDEQGQQAPSKVMGNVNGFPTQVSTYGQGNVPQGMEGRPNPGIPPIGQIGQQPQPDQQSQVNQILQQLKLTPGQGIANAMSVLGGGKQIYNPDLEREAVKSHAGYKALQPNYVTTYDANGQPSFTQAPAGHIINAPKQNGMVAQGTEVPEGFKLLPNGKIAPDPTYRKPLSEAQDWKFQQDQQAKESQSENVKVAAQDMLNTIQEVKKGMGYFGVAGGLPSIPILTGDYGKRKNWENNINKLTSEKVIQLMNQMKQASRTGATGFGALNQSELALLQSAATALSRDLNPEDAKRYIDVLESRANQVLNGSPMDGGSDASFDEVGSQQATQSTLTPEQQAKRERLRQKFGV